MPEPSLELAISRLRTTLFTGLPDLPTLALHVAQVANAIEQSQPGLMSAQGWGQVEQVAEATAAIGAALSATAPAGLSVEPT